MQVLDGARDGDVGGGPDERVVGARVDHRRHGRRVGRREQESLTGAGHSGQDCGQVFIKITYRREINVTSIK